MYQADIDLPNNTTTMNFHANDQPVLQPNYLNQTVDNPLQAEMVFDTVYQNPEKVSFTQEIEMFIFSLKI